MKKLILFLLLPLVLIGQVKRNPENAVTSFLNDDYQGKRTTATFNGVDNYVTVTPDSTTRLYNFASGTAGQPPTDWILTSGAYTVETASPSPFNTSSTKYLQCGTAGVLSIPSSWAFGMIEMDVYKGADGNSAYFNFIADRINSGAGTFNGYYFFFASDEGLSLQRNSTTTNTVLAYSGASYVANTTWYRIRIVRNEAGVFSVYIKSSVTGNFVLVSTSGGSGTNPVTDLTYITSKYFVLDLDAGDRIANITMTQAVGQFDLNGYERITDSQNRDFEADTTDWVGAGNHSSARSSVDKKAGTYSLLITSTSVGDATSNYINLPSTSLNPIESAKKFTVEAWARATNSGCQITMQLGSQSKTFATISTVAGTFTKLVWNFLATTNEVDVPLKIFANQADQIYLDNVSLTQAYDLAIHTMIKPSSSGVYNIFGNKSLTASGLSNGFIVGLNSGTLHFKFGDGTYANDNNAGIISLTTLQLATISANRILNVNAYLNGIYSFTDAATMVILGKLLSNASIWAANLMPGIVQDTQLLRFSDIASSTFNAATAYNTYIQTGKYPQVTGGGAIVIFDSAINDGNGYQIKDNSVYKKHGTLSGTYEGFWNNKPTYYTQEFTFLASAISSSSATTTLLKLLANVKVKELVIDVDKFDTDNTLSIGITGNDSWLTTITGTNVSGTASYSFDKGYSNTIEKQLYIKKAGASVYGRIKLKFKFEYSREL